MTSKVDLWMPIYIGDYLSATSRLSTEQHGAYLLLIMDYWKNGALPNDDHVLAQITRMTPTAWGNARSILQAFFSIENNLWIHARVEKEILKARDNREKTSARASKAATARWANKDATSNATSITQAMPKQCPSPSPSPSSLSLPLTSTSNKTTKDIATKVADGAFEEFWQHYPKKVGKGQAQKTWDKLKIKVIDEILNSLKWQRVCEQWQKDGGQFIPNPSTYLSQQRWLDEQPMPTKVIAYETPYQKSMRERVEEISPNIARKVSRPINFNFVEDIQDVITDQSN